MRIVALIATLASLSFVAATSKKVYFVAKGDMAQEPIGAVSEGTDFGYFLMGAGSFGVYYDFEDGIVSRTDGSEKEYVGLLDHYLAVGPHVPRMTFNLTDDVVNNYNFWACRDTDDPHEYSKKYFLLTVNDLSNKTAPFNECTPMKILIEDEFAT